MKILYVKNGSERNKKFQLQTTIFDENGQKYVKKQALCKDAILHLKKMKESYEKLISSIKNPKIKLAKIIDESEDSLTFEFIEGVSLEKKFVDAKRLGKSASSKVIDEYIELLRTGFKTTSFDSTTMVTEEFIKLFGDYDYSHFDGELCFADISNIDLIFSNIIYKDDEIYIIDYEWGFDICVPIEYILYRNPYIQIDSSISHVMEENFIRNYVFYFYQYNYLKYRYNILQQLQEKDHQLQEKDHQLQERDQQFQEKDQQLQKNDLLIRNQNQIIQQLQDLAQSMRIKNRIKKLFRRYK